MHSNEEVVVYEDHHGTVTETDLIAAAREAFQAYDQEEAAAVQPAAPPSLEAP